jgi:hypothetical protein
MYVKRVARAAAIAASVGMTGLSAGVGLAGAVPLAPPSCNQQGEASCQPAPGPANGPQGGAPQSPSGGNDTHDRQGGNAPESPQGGGNAPQSPENSAPPSTQAPSTQAPSTQPPSTQAPSTQAPSTQGNAPHDEHGNAPQTTQSSAPETTQGNGPRDQQGNRPNDQQGHGPETSQPSTSSQSPQTSSSERPRDVPRPPPFTPSGSFDRGNDQVGGPRDAPRGFSAPDHGAPPPPPERGPGWNDGPAPGGPPPNWDGPPPEGGWDGPPPPGGWNRRWDGPPRDIDQGRRDFGRFNYGDYAAEPVFNPMFGGFGFWFFGLWIPLF